MNAIQTLRRVVLVVILAVLYFVEASAASNYRITMLSPLSGRYNSTGYSINNSGDVVGSTDNDYATLWASGQGATRISDVPFHFAAGLAINNHGQILSIAYPSIVWNTYVTDPVRGTLNIGYLDNANPYTIGSSMNDRGQAVGLAACPGPRACSFIWDARNGIREMPQLANMNYLKINNSGQIAGANYSGAGFTQDRAFVWNESSGVTYLGAPPGMVDPTGSIAGAINDHGQIVGQLFQGSDSAAFIWDATLGMRSLGYLSNYSNLNWAGASDINELGNVVGSSSSNIGDAGFLWSAQSGMQDLNTLIDPADPLFGVLHITRGKSINDHNQIVAQGELSGRVYALLMSPVPEPSAYALMLVGLSAIGLAVARCRRHSSM